MTGEHLVPWELRVLNVRLQALGFGDPRRAVMSYHELAREARDHASKASARHDNSARELWKARLHDLGIKVAGALIEMDDLSGAAHHLGTLRDRGDGKVPLSKALLWLHLGDAEKARSCARQCSGDAADTEKIILALCDMADAEYEAAVDKWQSLSSLSEGDEMVGVNTAVCLLYLGKMHEVSPHDMAHSQAVYQSLLIGPQDPRGTRRLRLIVAHAPVQPVDDIRALRGEEPQPEDEARRPGRGHAGVAGGVGEDECRLQAVTSFTEQRAIS